jgi:adenylylsulfate kinase-like enzyme
MILWIRGKRKSGKTTLAKQFMSKMKAVHLDGDDMRASISADLGFSDEDRLKNNIRIAKLAKILENQGNDVIVSTICPDHVVEEVFNLTGCKFINL